MGKNDAICKGWRDNQRDGHAQQRSACATGLRNMSRTHGSAQNTCSDVGHSYESAGDGWCFIRRRLVTRVAHGTIGLDRHAWINGAASARNAAAQR